MKSILGVYIFFMAASQTMADERQDWLQAIDVVSTMSEDYTRRADAAGEYLHLGTMMNELDVPRHVCSILGRMLGKTELTIHLETPYPEVTDGEQTFRAAAISLDNWVYNARRLLDNSVPQRISEWNISCVGQMGIPASAKIAEPAGQILISVNANYLNISGAVEKGYAQRLEQALNQYSGITSVGLSGGGNDLAEAMEAARLIRRFGMDTTVVNGCTGACALVFLGGVNRSIWSPYPDLGMSPVIMQGQPQPASSQAYRVVSQFADEMGTNGQVFVQMMQAGPVSGFRNGRADRLCNARIATWIQRACSAP